MSFQSVEQCIRAVFDNSEREGNGAVGQFGFKGWSGFPCGIIDVSRLSRSENGPATV